MFSLWIKLETVHYNFVKKKIFVFSFWSFIRLLKADSNNTLTRTLGTKQFSGLDSISKNIFAAV